jgi:S-formylglutathione hydrolase FrmB
VPGGLSRVAARPAALAAALGAALAVGAAGPASAAPDPRLLDTQQLSPRLQELTLRTPALAAPTHVRVLLPAGYRSHPKRRYPVLYLLHGAGDDYRAWTRPDAGKGEAELLTAKLPLIVVMPDGGRGGFYTDWFNNGAGGQPRWETWHIRRLIPFVDHRYRTVAARKGRAIAGLSMGGFGTFTYAARHPDLFNAALSMSGAVDTTVVPSVIDAIAVSNGAAPGSLWGSYDADQVRWRGHNPFDLAENLRGLALWLRTGNGQPGGPFPGSPGVDAIEAGVWVMAKGLHARLLELGIPHVYDDYGAGQHLWPYWNRDLKQTLPSIMARFRKAPRPPARVTFSAVEPRYSVYGWNVSVRRPVLEFSRLANASRAGFSLSGSGSATVTTPPAFAARGRYVVSIARGRAKPESYRVVATRSGRLHVVVPLGTPNKVQQYAPGATTEVFTTRVRITRAP